MGRQTKGEADFKMLRPSHQSLITTPRLRSAAAASYKAQHTGQKELQQHEIIPVNQLIPIAVAEDLLDLKTFMTHDPLGFAA